MWEKGNEWDWNHADILRYNLWLHNPSFFSLLYRKCLLTELIKGNKRKGIIPLLFPLLLLCKLLAFASPTKQHAIPYKNTRGLFTKKWCWDYQMQNFCSPGIPALIPTSPPKEPAITLPNTGFSAQWYPGRGRFNMLYTPVTCCFTAAQNKQNSLKIFFFAGWSGFLEWGRNHSCEHSQHIHYHGKELVL